MEPEFVIDEEPTGQSGQVREAILAAIKREIELRQGLREKHLTHEEELLQEAGLLREIIAVLEERCDKWVQTERMRLNEGQGGDQATQEEKAKWLRRVERIQQGMDAALKRYGVTRYVPSGLALPERDDIVETVSGTQQRAGTIITVIKPGYLWRGELLRHAEVSVAD